jgi:hypothetical protein
LSGSQLKAPGSAGGYLLAINKLHDEFHTLDMASGWEVPPGYPSGIQQKILAGSLDEKGKRGSRTRLLRFDPGIYTTAPFVHDYWEEVFLLSGDLMRKARVARASRHSPTPAVPGRRARPVPLPRRLHAAGDPLLRPGVKHALVRWAKVGPGVSI